MLVTPTTPHSDEEALDWVHDLVAYLPSNNRQQAPLELTDFEEEITEEDLKLDEIIPDSPTQPYDVREVIESLSDDGEFWRFRQSAQKTLSWHLAASKARPLVCCKPANRLRWLLGHRLSEKAARFIRTCDSFNIPLVLLVDVPGFLPGLTRSTAVFCVAARSCFTLTVKQPFQDHRHHAQGLWRILRDGFQGPGR